MKRKTYFLILCLIITGTVLNAVSAISEHNPEAALSEQNLILDASLLTGEPVFVDWIQEGTDMQLIARKDDTGTVRLAFNTCQSCGGSPYAWFEYTGDGLLQCQNCGQNFPLETVGITRKAGCNPLTITEFTLENDIVTVPESVLSANAVRFLNWKKADQ